MIENEELVKDENNILDSDENNSLESDKNIENKLEEDQVDASNDIFDIKDKIKSEDKYKEVSLSKELKPVEEMEIENMKFKKVGMDSLNIDTFEDSDLEFNSDNEESKEELDHQVKEEDIEIVNEIPKKTEENLDDTKNEVKTIIIDNDKNNTLKKYTKDKKKSFRFFD